MGVRNHGFVHWMPTEAEVVLVWVKWEMHLCDHQECGGSVENHFYASLHHLSSNCFCAHGEIHLYFSVLIYMSATQVWPIMHTALVDAGVKSVTPEEVMASQLIVLVCIELQ